MQETYKEAIDFVFRYEGGYTNNPSDPGGPTNWGITLEDAKRYWLPSATAQDVASMPRSVADNIYFTHYASPIQYNSLPAGVDLSVLDYAVNSGVSRSIHTLQGLVNVPQDGQMGPITLKAVGSKDPTTLINQIWDERLAFDKSLPTWSTFGHGWTARIEAGKKLALSMSANPVAKPSVPNNGLDPTNSAFANPLDSLISFFSKLFKGKQA